MDVVVPRLGRMEEPQQVDRIGLETVRIADVEAPGFRLEGTDVAPPRQDPGKIEPRLALVLGFEGGAEDARQVAHVLGGQIIVLHEPLDAARSGTVRVAHARADLDLHVEGQPILRPVGEIVQMTAHGRKELFRLLEASQFRAGQDATSGEVRDILDLIEVLGNPVEGVQIAQSSLAILDVGLQHVT